MKRWMMSLAFLTMTQTAWAEEVSLTPEALVERGLKAGAAFPGLADVCDLSRPLLTAGRRPPSAEGNARRELSAEERARRNAAAVVEPVQVFDNLYFVGTRGVASWVIETSDGLIVVDALNNDEEAKTFIEGGLRTLGLDPNDIRYLVITHAHGDHYGGQKYLVDTYKPKVLMSDEDWSELEKPELQFSNPRWGAPPVRDLSVSDGDVIVLGDTTVQLHLTPGHTPGTLSLIFPVQDGETNHVASLWGGTGLNFGPNEERMRAYAMSAERFRATAETENVDIFLSNHPRRDGALESIAALEERSEGEPHPFVLGPGALGAFELLRDCALAQAESIKAGTRTTTP